MAPAQQGWIVVRPKIPGRLGLCFAATASVALFGAQSAGAAQPIACIARLGDLGFVFTQPIAKPPAGIAAQWRAYLQQQYSSASIGRGRCDAPDKISRDVETLKVLLYVGHSVSWKPAGPDGR